jgi:hypothetical protein
MNSIAQRTIPSTKITARKNYFVSVASIEPSADISEIVELIRATRFTGELTILYNQGGVIGIILERWTRVCQADADLVHALLDK